MKIYGKPIGPVLKHKNDFFTKNVELLNEVKRVASEYKKQPLRRFCKICKGNINSYSMSFKKNDIEYRLCSECGHLNGLYEDTKEYAEIIYKDLKYAAQYLEKDLQKYNQRLVDIYLPKVEFLFDALKKDQAEPNKLKYSDFGAGSGYMVAALEQQGVETSGFEMSKAQVDYGKQIKNLSSLYHINIDDIYEVAKTTDANVVTMIGVIEHLNKPNQVMQNLFENRNVQYVLLTFPMFSPTVFFEIAFPNVFPRHLALGHTHLFQESSINYFLSSLGFKRIAEWWFGTDIMDLVRSIEVTLNQNKCNNTAIFWRQNADSLIDDLQLVMDKHQVASQVHILIKPRLTKN